MSAPRPLPDGLVLSFYGDDFTGSTAVMEVMAFAGLPTMLFLGLPTAAQLARVAGHRAIGIAGVARSRSTEWMDEHLPPVFRTLAGLGAPVAQYKICSTFDSAPHAGSIGRAIDLAVPVLGGVWHPLLAAAPANGRFQAFGNLFASVDGVGHRLDRHPTMSRHPVTPMGEADLRLHLARQTVRRIGLVDFVAMKSGGGGTKLRAERAAGADIIALDVMDEETLAEAGRLVWEEGGPRVFAAASQGLNSALVAYWRQAGLLPRAVSAFRVPAVSRIAAVSGSCSPVTAGQIEQAGREGFRVIRLDAARAVDEAAWSQAVGEAADRALAALGEGADPLVVTAEGPSDPALARMADAVEASGMAIGTVNNRVGAGLGRLLDRVMAEGGLARAVIAGGDTSGHAALSLGIHALTAVASIAPGVPLCRAHADDRVRDGREVALKGGQMGATDFFSAAKRGSIN